LVFSVTLIGDVSHQFPRVLDLMSDTGRISFPGDSDDLSHCPKTRGLRQAEYSPYEVVVR